MRTIGSIPEYDVCLSFASEQRAYVQKVSEILIGQGIRVFYDTDFEAHLWGKNLYEELSRIYRDEAKYCILFASQEYILKRWTNHEWRAAQERALADSHEYVLPVRFDDIPVPGLANTIAYLDARTHPPEKVAALIVEKLRRDNAVDGTLTSVELLDRAVGMGLVGIENRANPAHASPPVNYIRLAVREVTVTGITAKYTFTRLAEVLRQALSQDVIVRAMILDPSSLDLMWLREQESIDLQREIETVRDIITAQFANHPGFEARFLRYAPPFTAIALDGLFIEPNEVRVGLRPRLRIQPSVRHASQHRGIILEFAAIPSPGNVENASTPFEFFGHDLRRQWETATPFTRD